METAREGAVKPVRDLMKREDGRARMREQRRHMKKLFEELRDLVPSTHKSKTSILESAMRAIKLLRQENAALQLVILARKEPVAENI